MLIGTIRCSPHLRAHINLLPEHCPGGHRGMLEIPQHRPSDLLPLAGQLSGAHLEHQVSSKNPPSVFRYGPGFRGHVGGAQDLHRGGLVLSVHLIQLLGPFVNRKLNSVDHVFQQVFDGILGGPPPG